MPACAPVCSRLRPAAGAIAAATQQWGANSVQKGNSVNFGAGPNATKGHAALKKMIVDLKTRNTETETKTGKPRPAMYHMEMNHSLEFTDKEHAVLKAYWTTTFAGENRGDAARIAAVGWESNQLVKVNGKWLIQVRDTAPKE